MANEKNLIPNSERSPTEVRENGRKGGIASGKARRDKRTIQQIITSITDADVSTLQQFAVLARKMGLESDKSIKEVYSVLCLLNSAKTANLSDLALLQKLRGEQTETADTDEQKQTKAHSELIKALKERQHED